MTGRRLILAVALAGSLLTIAIGAQSASAVTLGTTIFTCKKVTPAQGTEGFIKEHCRPVDAVETNAEYEHFKVEQGKTTEATVTNAKTRNNTTEATPWLIKGTVAGAVLELTAKGAHSEGTIENSVDPSTEHYFHAAGKVAFEEVTSPLCAVAGLPGGAGKIESKQLADTTTEQGHFIKFTPETGTVFAEFELTGCAMAGVYKVVGSVKGVPNGSTINFTHAETTAQKTLRIGSAAGPLLGVEGSLTLTGRANKTEAFTPLSPTTVETP